ncbi:MAG: hypothetical protein Q4C70_07870, partial [Planctomycetia bacterium]|nr:hypothetical protein [Planctomycetia bacterium]
MKNGFLEKLNHYRRLKWRSTVEFWLETLFLVIGFLFLLASIVDFILWRGWFLEISVLRWGIFGGMVLVLVIGVWQFWRRVHDARETPYSRWETFYFLRRRYFQETERGKTLGLRPPSGNVESALDFLENPRAEAENELRDAVIRQADEEMNTFEPEKWMKLEKMWRIRWPMRCATVFLGVILGILGAYGEENTSVAVQRFIFPWENVGWKIDFQPQWKTFSDEVMAGETFDGEIVLRKGAPYVCVALWKSKTETEPFRVVRVLPIFGRYRIRIPNVRESFYVSVFLPGEELKNQGEGTENTKISEDRGKISLNREIEQKLVRVRTAPRLRDALVRVQAPAVTRQAAKVSDWEITGLTGSRIGVMIVADRPLSSARIRFDNATYVPGVPVGKASSVKKAREN